MADSKMDTRAIFAIFIGVIITATIIVAIADQINLNTNTRTVTNGTVTLGAVNATIDTTGRTLLTRVAITNATEETANIPALILQSGISATTGLESVQIVSNDTGQTQGYVSGITVNATYTYEPDGFVGGAARNITLLILIFAALAILIFVVIVIMKQGLMAKLMGGK